jgi:ABC-type branched-subunit amino acid transport system ATPase component
MAPAPSEQLVGAGTTPDPAGLLVLEGVVAGYGGGDVLRGVSFAVPKGSITCVVGPNGAGKSTVLAAISGILRPRRGNICFEGQSLVGRTPREILGRGVVQVPQNHSLFREMTVRENVEMGAFTLRDRGLARRRLEQVMEMFPIARERAKDQAGALSGGQQRLIEFARCLMLDPALVILDEPSMGLDPRTLRRVFATIRMMHEQGRTILLVEQNARAGLRLSTHGVVMENGMVRLSGTGREVLDNPEIGALYLGGSVSGATTGQDRPGPSAKGPERLAP